MKSKALQAVLDRVASRKSPSREKGPSPLGLEPREETDLVRAHQKDRFHDECAVFGIHGHEEAAHIAYLGLYAMQHRGQESCGIVSSAGGEHLAHRAMGLVADIFGRKALARLEGRHAIGHVRYSTAGESLLRNAQPICANTDGGPVAIAHNGNLVNANTIRKELEGRGAISDRPPTAKSFSICSRVLGSPRLKIDLSTRSRG